MPDVEALMQKAIRHFWKTRQSQSDRQGATTGIRDKGNRTAVTGGKHADGFVKLVKEVVKSAGVTDAHIQSTQKVGRTLPGFFRPAPPQARLDRGRRRPPPPRTCIRWNNREHRARIGQPTQCAPPNMAN